MENKEPNPLWGMAEMLWGCATVNLYHIAVGGYKMIKNGIEYNRLHAGDDDYYDGPSSFDYLP